MPCRVSVIDLSPFTWATCLTDPLHDVGQISMTSTQSGLMEPVSEERRAEGRIRREVLAVVVLVLALLLVPGAPCVANVAARSDPTGTSSASRGSDAVSTAPVISHVRVSSWTFEGHQVYSYVPSHPVGLVFMFHGSNGGADFARKIESVDLLNELTDRGYGFVATDSTERTGRKQWDIVDTTTQTNPDLARIDSLRQRMVNTTPVTPATPVYGIGMSNGSAFVCLWATASAAAGQAVSAVGMYMDGVPASVRARWDEGSNLHGRWPERHGDEPCEGTQ